MALALAAVLLLLLVAAAWLLGLCGSSGDAAAPVGGAPASATKSGLAGKRQQRTQALLSSKDERMNSLRLKALARYNELYGAN